LVLSHFGRRIPSPRHHCLSRLAHPIAYLLRLALIAPKQAAYCADSAKSRSGLSPPFFYCRFLAHRSERSRMASALPG
jgi:hypothetical protein